MTHSDFKSITHDPKLEIYGLLLSSINSLHHKGLLMLLLELLKQIIHMVLFCLDEIGDFEVAILLFSAN